MNERKFIPSHICVKPHDILKIGEHYMLMGYRVGDKKERCLVINKQGENLVFEDVIFVL